MEKNFELKFNVARDAEAKKAKELHEVTIRVKYDSETDLAAIVSDAMANMAVKFQSQIRSHWDEFVEGKCPSEVTYGQALFGTRQRTTVRPPTEEEVSAFMAARIAKMNPTQIMEFARTGKFPEGI